MKRLLLVSLILSSVGCARNQATPHTGSLARGLLERGGWYRSGPVAKYDAIFYCDCENSGNEDERQLSYQSNVRFFDSIGHPYMPAGSTVSLNGIRLSDSVMARLWVHSSLQDLHFPQPVTWSVSGNGFPNFIHTLKTPERIAILSPQNGDSIRIDRPIEIRYSAPGGDSLMIRVVHQGIGVWRKAKDQTQGKVATSMYRITPNTGRFVLPAFTVDSSLFASFWPTYMSLDLLDEGGDTIHVKDKILGFVNRETLHNHYTTKP